MKNFARFGFFLIFCVAATAFAGDKAVETKHEASKPLTQSLPGEEIQGEIVSMFWGKNDMIIVEELPVRYRPDKSPLSATVKEKNNKPEPGKPAREVAAKASRNRSQDRSD